MTVVLFIVAAVFLPLFPFGMIFTDGFERLRNGWVRALLLVVWPVVGMQALTWAAVPPPTWLVAWAMLSALFYAWRALALREAGQWIAYLAVSAWPLLWAGEPGLLLALAIGLPPALLSLVVGRIDARFGGAHMALDLRLGTIAPRLAGLFVTGVLAAVAMPPSPGFFALVALVVAQAQTSLATVLAILGTWLLWSWSAARLLRGIVAGPGGTTPPRDMPAGAAWGYALAFSGLGICGLILGGHLL